MRKYAGKTRSFPNVFYVRALETGVFDGSEPAIRQDRKVALMKAILQGNSFSLEPVS